MNNNKLLRTLSQSSVHRALIFLSMYSQSSSSRANLICVYLDCLIIQKRTPFFSAQLKYEPVFCVFPIKHGLEPYN